MFVTRYWRADHLRVAGQESGGGMLNVERVLTKKPDLI